MQGVTRPASLCYYSGAKVQVNTLIRGRVAFMHKAILHLLACPDCRAPLVLHDGAGVDGDRIIFGVLRCRGGHAFPVIRGVPILFAHPVLGRFLNDYDHAYMREHQKEFAAFAPDAEPASDVKEEVMRSSDNWSFQWEKYGDAIADSVWAEDATFFEHIPLPPGEFAGRVVLDAGCGAGRNSRRFGGSASRAVGVDISKSVYVAERMNRHPAVDFVQGDLSRLPFRDGAFDIVFSDHVLQHVDDIDAVFREFRRVAKPGGGHRAAFNLYSRENNDLMTRLVEPAKRMLRNRVPNRVNILLGNLLGGVLWCAIQCVYRPLHAFPRLYRLLPLGGHMAFWFHFSPRMCAVTCYDLLHAPIANYYSSADVDALCERTGLSVECKELLRQTLWVVTGRFR